MNILEKIRRWKKLGTLDRDRATKATAKKHKHVESEQFKSINHAGISPAEFRHGHYIFVNGKLRKRGNKK